MQSGSSMFYMMTSNAFISSQKSVLQFKLMMRRYLNFFRYQYDSYSTVKFAIPLLIPVNFQCLHISE